MRSASYKLECDGIIMKCFLFVFVGNFSQYDGMVVPRHNYSYIEKLKKTVFGEKLKIPSHEKSQEDSLWIFLAEQHNVFCKLEFQTIKGVNFVNNIIHVYKQLYSQSIQNVGLYQQVQVTSKENWFTFTLTEVTTFSIAVINVTCLCACR